jgi:hypothetical protein
MNNQIGSQAGSQTVTSQTGESVKQLTLLLLVCVISMMPGVAHNVGAQGTRLPQPTLPSKSDTSKAPPKFGEQIILCPESHLAFTITNDSDLGAPKEWNSSYSLSVVLIGAFIGNTYTGGSMDCRYGVATGPNKKSVEYVTHLTRSFSGFKTCKVAADKKSFDCVR